MLIGFSFYQGSEVAISGWVISYLIHYRDGDPSKVGNVTSGFWGGITLGRFILIPLAHRVGLKLFAVLLLIGAAVFQSLVWAIPDIITNAVAESIVGFFLGPIYPVAMAVFARLWPRNIQVSSVALVSSMGSSGAAFLPFITGLLAQRLTTVVLHPIALFSFAMMTVAWLCLPKVVKPTK
jgi:fucose permease